MPFKVLYGRDPLPLLCFEKGSMPVSIVEQQLSARDCMLHDLKLGASTIAHEGGSRNSSMGSAVFKRGLGFPKALPLSPTFSRSSLK